LSVYAHPNLSVYAQGRGERDMTHKRIRSEGKAANRERNDLYVKYICRALHAVVTSNVCQAHFYEKRTKKEAILR